MDNSYLKSTITQFKYNKTLADKTFNQLTKDELFWQYNKESNSIAIIVKHIAGNMLSRWTKFLTEDGEKPWRDRDNEFINTFNSKQELIDYWEKGWKCLFASLDDINEENKNTIVYISNHGHTITEAINRQLCHYSYHIGQIVVLGKMVKNENWETLSVPKGASKIYNEEKFSKKKRRTHFTEDL